jgi:dipeptidyl aminopeptidase/acylaminoacyl peptidase
MIRPGSWGRGHARYAALVAICLLAAHRAVAQQEIPIKSFARLPAISDISLSPDGRYLAMIRSLDDTSGAFVLDLQNKGSIRPVLGEDKDHHFQLTRCNWANNTRLLCSYLAMNKEFTMVYPVTRLVAVNADGSELKVLLQNSRVGGSQLQDKIIDWTFDAPDTVLIAADEDRNSFPEVYELNVYTGGLRLRTRERQPIRDFVSDRAGNVRLGFGMEGLSLSYYARLADDKEWLRLEKFTAFSEGDRLRPIAISPDHNKVFATGTHQGRDALWEMDLTDRQSPKLIFSHPQVDASNALVAKDGRMLGILYETDRPFAFYTDPLASSVIDAVKPLVPPGSFNFIVDYSLDENIFVIHSSSDVDGGTYYMLNRRKGEMATIGNSYPELRDQQAKLARMQSIHYPARDGADIPGYLTVPVGKRAEKLPLIVLPHGGPTARDSWGFGWLEQFLASRGYAVLQMNFRGSAGYGDDWLMSAHQDWGGLTYDDIVDGTRWAIKQGIADPERICIAGWSFGGYAALLGAARNPDLFKCSASIAGVSDLIELENDERAFINGKIAREQIGTDREKLKRDSPRRQADAVGMPVLLIHGDMDYQVRFEHSSNMASALKRAKKEVRLVKIEEADHQMSRTSQRVTLLTELERFLKEKLGTRP